MSLIESVNGFDYRRPMLVQINMADRSMAAINLKDKNPLLCFAALRGIRSASGS